MHPVSSDEFFFDQGRYYLSSVSHPVRFGGVTIAALLARLMHLEVNMTVG